MLADVGPERFHSGAVFARFGFHLAYDARHIGARFLLDFGEQDLPGVLWGKLRNPLQFGDFLFVDFFEIILPLVQGALALLLVSNTLVDISLGIYIGHYLWK